MDFNRAAFEGVVTKNLKKAKDIIIKNGSRTKATIRKGKTSSSTTRCEENDGRVFQSGIRRMVRQFTDRSGGHRRHRY